MERIKKIYAVKSEELKHNGDIYKRNVYNTGVVLWTPISYDGESEGAYGELEKAYQAMIAKEKAPSKEFN